MFIDTHAHLYWDSFKEDFDDMVQRAKDAGVNTIINVGVDVEKSHVALEQSQNTNWPTGMTVYSTIGIHPHAAAKYFQLGQKPHDRNTFVLKDIDKLAEIYESNPQMVVAVGECGLDFAFEKNEKIIDAQRELLEAQIELASKLNLPLIIHCREAWDYIFNYFRGGERGVFHTFSGSGEDAARVLSLGFFLSFSCIITYPKNDHLREAIKKTPLDRLLIETDSPFLPPQNKRGQRNEPSNVVEVAKTIAEIKNLNLEELAKILQANTKKLFKI